MWGLAQRFGLKKASLCYSNSWTILDIGSCHGKSDFFISCSDKASKQPQEGGPDCQHQCHCSLGTCSCNWGLFLHWQLGISSWLAKLPLSETKTHRAHFNKIWSLFLSSLLAWNNGIFNLSRVWSVLFLYWFIRRHNTLCYLSVEFL